MKSFEGSFCNLNFSPSTSILLNFFFPFIDIRYSFFWQVLQYSRTIVLLKKLKPLKKPLFQKRRWSCDFPPIKTPIAQKHRAISRQEKKAFSTPTPVGLLLGFPFPLSAEYLRTGRTDWRSRDYYVTIIISRIDRLPNLLSNGASLAGVARRLRYKLHLIWWKNQSLTAKISYENNSFSFGQLLVKRLSCKILFDFFFAAVILTTLRSALSLISLWLPSDIYSPW